MADGARIRAGSRVRWVWDEEKAVRGATPPPPGVWYALSRSPVGPSHWWVMANDDTARTWAAEHPREVISGCIDAAATQLELINAVRL